MKSIMLNSILLSILLLTSIALATFYVPIFKFSNPVPTPSGEFYNLRQVGAGITVNASAQECGYLLENGTNYTMTTADNLTFTNATPLVFSISNGGSLRYITYYCNYNESRDVLDWYNSTGNMPAQNNFTINEKATNSFTITDLAFTNYAVYSNATFPTFNITTSTSIATCNYTFNNGTGGANNFIMVNNTPNHKYWSNASVIGGNMTPNTNNSWINITYYCNDTFGNGTEASKIYFKYDRANPKIGNVSITYNNTSTSPVGSKINVTFDVADANYKSDGAYVRLYHPDGTVTAVQGTALTSMGYDVNLVKYGVIVTGTDMNQNGLYYIEPFVIDAANQNGTSANLTVLVTQLKAAKWNLLTWYENATLQDLASKASTITYVSLFNNWGKNFTTFQKGTSTNAFTMINESTNVTLIYVSSDTTLIRNYTKYDVAGFAKNISLYASNNSYWNLVNLNRMPATLNATMNDSSAYMNASVQWNTSYPANNVSYISFYNASSGKFCTAKRTMGTLTSCVGIASTDITIGLDTGFWLYVGENMTMNRTEVDGR